MTTIPRVFVYLMNAYTTHAAMLRGVLDYVRGHTPWSLDLRTGRREESSLRRVDWSACDAAIVNAVTPELLSCIHARGLPVVFVNACDVPGFPGCVLCCDNRPIADAASKFLLSRELASYAYVGAAGMVWSAERGDAFCAAIEAAGAACFRWRPSSMKALARHIAAAPKPLGVFASDDIRSRIVLDACRMAGCSVPDEVEILGVDNDETLCEFSSPALSSIPLSSRAAGTRAAEILDAAMHGRIKPCEMPDAVYTGNAVIERQSTSRAFSRDALVRKCSAFIESNFHSPIHIDAMARNLNVSRRTLEMRFRAAKRTSIASEITRLRMEHAQKLLAQTDQPQEQIAAACGFFDAGHMSKTFRKCLNAPPSSFRTKQAARPLHLCN